MPLIKVVNINTSSIWAMWKITESLDTLLSHSIGNDIENFFKENITHPVKQKEWLSARLVLKFLAEEMGRSYSGCTKDRFGKPHLENNGMFVSITNSFPYAAAIICRKAPVGIDLEVPKPKLKVLAHKFLNDEELLEADGDVLKLCLYWCAKETLFKIYGRNNISFKEHLFIAPFSLNNSGNILGTICTQSDVLNFDICYQFIDSFLISYNINK